MTNEQWTILKMIEWVSGYLQEKGVPNFRIDAEHLIAHALSVKRLDLYLKFDRVLTQTELDAIRPLVARRAKREPLQHILGTQAFRNVDVRVTADVLIPRPETEILVGECLKAVPTESEFEILELGVGSGAVLLALANERPNIRLTGIDVSEKAIAIANANTDAYRDRITILHGDLFSPLAEKKFDIIISNPPYIPEAVWETLQPEVRDFEPREALVGGKDGLDFYRRILKDAPMYLKEGGRVFLEFGDGQGAEIKKIAEEAGTFTDIWIVKDLANVERVFCARLFSLPL